MANQFAAAFDELKDCFAAETGESHSVTIAGTAYPCVPTEITKDEMLVHGGTGENGGFSFEVKASLFGVPPAKVQTVVYKTTTLSVLSFKKVNEATYLFVAGDFTRNP